jgi:hypothetical protein
VSLIIVLHNDGSGTETAANYDVQVRVNQRVIATARVEGHNRADGWKALVKKFIEEQT